MRYVLMTSLVTLAGCSMNPKLDVPPAPVAATYPSAVATGNDPIGVPRLSEMFGDPRLRQLIALALNENRDLRVAVLNARASRAQFRFQRGARLPALDVQAGYSRQRTPTDIANVGFDLDTSPSDRTGIEYGQYTAQAFLSTFELDISGRLRSLSQAAFERYLATEEGRRAATITVVSTVAETYLAERLAEEQLRLTQSTQRDWEASLDLTRRLKQAGQNSALDVAQAEGLVRQVRADLARRERELSQATNALVLAVGAPVPKDLPAPIPLLRQPVHTRIAAGLPSDLLLMRPDIVAAEHELRASNADIGAARAAFFPRLSLTAAFGFASLGLDGLFNGDNRTWSFQPSITAPIFQRGQLKSNLEISTLRKAVAIANYERTIQAAFREVSDGLAGRETFASQAREQDAALQEARKRVGLATLRFQAGVDSRLELLDAERSAYGAEQAFLEVRRAELLNAIKLFTSLGGGFPRSVSRR